MNKLLNDNRISKESGIHKYKVGVSGVSAESTNIFTQSSDVWA
jgi:hypothetical protein